MDRLELLRCGFFSAGIDKFALLSNDAEWIASRVTQHQNRLIRDLDHE